jgi:hypothetical protein
MAEQHLLIKSSGDVGFGPVAGSASAAIDNDGRSNAMLLNRTAAISEDL